MIVYKCDICLKEYNNIDNFVMIGDEIRDMLSAIGINHIDTECYDKIDLDRLTEHYLKVKKRISVENQQHLNSVLNDVRKQVNEKPKKLKNELEEIKHL
jgi:phosphoglycolate phosphatase-like HAD superfamily hydrolase